MSDDTASTPHSLSVPKDLRPPQSHSLGNAFLNVWYPDKSLNTTIPAPEELLQILGAYIDFGRGSPSRNLQLSATPSVAATKLKKGMTPGQVLNLLGAPRQSREHLEEGVKVVTNTFQSAQESIEVDFVKNAVVDFRIRPR